MRPVIIIHYHEIALKGRNRNAFEHRLIANIKRSLEDVDDVRVQRMSGRIVLCGSGVDDLRIRDRLLHVFGIVNFYVGFEVRQDRDGLVADSVVAVKHWLGSRPARTFAVRAKRSDKSYPETSADIECCVGAAVQGAAGLRVDLEHPDLTVFIEIVEDTAFVLLEKVVGPGGLPVGVSGRVACLLSSGFDSPVAAWRMMKRGAEIVFVHFHSYPHTSDASIRNVQEIAARLAAWQGPSVLVTVPLIDFQKAVMIGAPHELRILLYRRAMIRVAEQIAAAERASVLVTGECLGQVASQTLPNIVAVEAAAALTILRPLVGFDKSEIMTEAERIGTAEISHWPYDDCCSLFTPAHPATGASVAELENVERELGLLDWTTELFARRERFVVAPSLTCDYQDGK